MIVVGFFFSFFLWSFGSLHILVLSFELWSFCISKKSLFLLLLDTFSLLSWWIHFLNLITLFLPLQVIYSRNIDFHQTLMKRILVNLVNTLAILSMVKWFKTPTFNFIYFITFLCGSSGLGYFTCFHALYLNFFPFVF